MTRTITLGVAKGLGARAAKTAIVSFDAHLDLRCEFLGSTLSHTTFMQLISEEVKPAKIFEVGTRSACKEELAYAKKAGVEFFASQQIIRQGSDRIAEQLKQKLAPYENVYLTVDMDVLDPAFAPAVQNPEPEGITTTALLDIACALCDKRMIGFDMVEIAPIYDQVVCSPPIATGIFRAAKISSTTSLVISTVFSASSETCRSPASCKAESSRSILLRKLYVSIFKDACLIAFGPNLAPVR